MHFETQSKLLKLACLAALVGALLVAPAQAGQGCPFDDGSCQTYCSQQGCNLGYCGHFAWIQCICRKCGDEWNWHDKVRYNPDKQVNQTELDSLKLNGSAPIILTSSSGEPRAPVQLRALETPEVGAAQPASAGGNKGATLTTLLIPDLSDPNNKLDPNEIPDENSEKFLDYLAKNHEKLVQATSKRQLQLQLQQQQPQQQQQQQQQQPPTLAEDNEETPSDETESEPQAEETIEIQISSSNNQATSAAVARQADDVSQSGARQREPSDEGAAQGEPEPETSAPAGAGPAGTAGQLTRLLRVAARARLAADEDDLY